MRLLSIKTLRADFRKRVPEHSGQSVVAINFVSSSRTDCDSVSRVAAFHVMDNTFELMLTTENSAAVVNVIKSNFFVITTK